MKRRALLLALGAGAGVHAASRVETDRLHGRTLRVYTPPSYAQATARRYPVLYLFDGQNVFDAAASVSPAWGGDTALDALAQAIDFEAIAVGIDHGGDTRLAELTPWAHPRHGGGQGDATLDFIVREVMPFVDSRWRTQPGTASTLIGGSSLGGLMAHYAMHRHADVFGRALVFSPAYWIAPAMAEFVRTRPLSAGARLYFYAGTAESESMVPLARRVHALLQRPGVATTLHIEPDAQHHESAWRAALPQALRWAFELRP